MLRSLRWWWFVGFGWLALYAVVVAPLWRAPWFRRWVWSSTGGLLLVIGLMLVGLAWLVVVAPYLESGAPRLSERFPGRRRARQYRLFAWIPATVFGVLLVQVLFVKGIGIDHQGWYENRYELWAAGAVVLAVFYGRMMSRTLTQRARTAAARDGRCFVCHYDISHGGTRCPECGAVSPRSSSTP